MPCAAPASLPAVRMWSLLEKWQKAGAGVDLTRAQQSWVSVMSWNYKPCESSDEKRVHCSCLDGRSDLSELEIQDEKAKSWLCWQIM